MNTPSRHDQIIRKSIRVLEVILMVFLLIGLADIGLFYYRENLLEIFCDPQPTCNYNGEEYRIGKRWIASDGCNGCGCDWRSSGWTCEAGYFCTDMWCPTREEEKMIRQMLEKGPKKT